MNKVFEKVISRLKRFYITIFNITDLKYKIYGVNLMLNLNKAVDKRLFINGFEKDVIKCFQKIVKEGHTVLDIGANIGIYSLIAGNKVGNKGKVYAFEPANEAYDKLRYHIKLNNLDNIDTIKYGVSNYSGVAEFNVCEDDAFNSLGDTPMKDVVRKETIDLITIDDFVLKNSINRVDIIKVDTEGAEFLVFEGAKKTLLKDKPSLFFEYNPEAVEGFDNNSINLINLLRSFDYSLFEFKEGNLIEVKEGDVIIGYDLIALSN